MMNRNNLVNSLSQEIYKQAAEEVLSSPLAKTASESSIDDAIVEKIAGVFDDAASIYKQAEEEFQAAEGQEALAREALLENGIDPDVILQAAQEAAVEQIAAAEAEEDEE